MTTSFDQNHQSAVLNLPSGSGDDGQKQSIPCLFSGMEGRRLVIELQERPPLSAAVSVEYNDALFLGEVISSKPESNGYWKAEVKVEQVLTGLQSLMNLRSRLLGEGVGASAGSSLSRVCA